MSEGTVTTHEIEAISSNSLADVSSSAEDKPQQSATSTVEPKSKKAKPRSRSDKNRQPSHTMKSSVHAQGAIEQGSNYFKPEDFNQSLVVGVCLTIHTDDIKSWLNDRYQRFAMIYSYGVSGLIYAKAASQVARYDAYVDRFLSHAELILESTLGITQPIVDGYLEQYTCAQLSEDQGKVHQISFHNHLHLRYLRILEQLDRLLTHYSFLNLVGHIDTPYKLATYRQWAQLPRKLEKKLILINQGIEKHFDCKMAGKNRAKNLNFNEQEVTKFIEQFSDTYASITNRSYELSVISETPNRLDKKFISVLSYNFAKDYKAGQQAEKQRPKARQYDNINDRLREI